MKKKDIVNLINLRTKEEKLSNINYINRHSYINWSTTHDDVIDEVLKTLREEYKDSLIEYEEVHKKIKSIDCSHEVRKFICNGLFNDCYCCICGKSIMPENVKDGKTVYNDPNRNNYYVGFTGWQDDEDLGYIGIKDEKIYSKILEKIKYKKDNEEVDLVSLLKKDKDVIKIENKEYKKYYYILLVGGANSVTVDNNYFISTKSYNNDALVDYLLGIPNVILEVFDNKEYTEADRSISYTSLDELEKIIKNERNVPFDIVIDTSNLFKYNDKIEKYNINLKSMFPTSEMISNPTEYKVVKEKINVKRLLK